MVIDTILNVFNSVFGNKETPVATNNSVLVPEPTTEVKINEAVQKIDEVVQFVSYATIPDRKSDAITGSQFITHNMNLGGSVREANILKEFQEGNVPDFLRNLVPVTVKNGTDSIVYYVMPDYLSLGTDQDYCRMPMTPLTAQKIADLYGCTLPTRKMVNDIWKQSSIKLTPLPWGAPYNEDMEATHRIGTQNTKIEQQLAEKTLGQLVSGSKKDVVLTNKLYPNNPNKKVAIYGWIQLDGTPIQGLNPSSHGSNYEDYSHGIRFISKKVKVNDQDMDIIDVFKDAKLSALVSDEGILKFLRY